MANVELEKMSAKELKDLVQEAQALIVKKEREERKTLLEEIRDLAAKRGFRLEDVLQPTEALTSTRRGRGRGSAKPKYRHPEDPAITWSGRGRKPKWIEEAESKGQLDATRIQTHAD